jgi:hypothetical protein
MLKSYSIKNTALRTALFNKFTVRLQADDAIAANRLVAANASTGAVEAAGADSMQVLGANQDVARVADDYFYVEQGVVTLTASEDVVAGERVKAAADGKIALWDNTADTADMLVGYVLVGAVADADAIVNLL